HPHSFFPRFSPHSSTEALTLPLTSSTPTLLASFPKHLSSTLSTTPPLRTLNPLSSALAKLIGSPPLHHSSRSPSLPGCAELPYGLLPMAAISSVIAVANRSDENVGALLAVVRSSGAQNVVVSATSVVFCGSSPAMKALEKSARMG